MRRNSDESLRDLERRVIEGDLSAVLQFHQERKRSGANDELRRERSSTSTWLVNVRGFGQVAFTPNAENELRVQFGETVRPGSGSHYSRQDVTLSPVLIRGVPHRGDIRFLRHTEEEGFVPLDPVQSGGQTWRERKTGFVYRTDQFHKEASDAAKATIVKLLTPVVNEWATQHPRSFLEGAYSHAGDDVSRSDREVAKAIEALDEARGALAQALMREIQLRDRIDRTPPDATTASNPMSNPATVTFWHGTPRSRLKSVLKNGLRVSSGWGGAGTSGVYLSGSPDRALYWAKMAWQLAHDEKMEESRFDRKYGDRVGEILALVQVTIPEESLGNLRADMEQAEDVGFEGEPEDWEASLAEIGDVMYDGKVPAEWLREVKLP